MSSGGGIAGGIVGAITGFIVGGPAGAIYGAQLGIFIGTAIDPPKGPNLQGPRLKDTSIQTSTYGADIPRLYGQAALKGNLIWLENNELKEVVTREEQESGGKGGGGSSQTVETYEYFATFAVAFCIGEVDSALKLWIGPDLVANLGSLDPETLAGSEALQYVDFDYGGTDAPPTSAYVGGTPQRFTFYPGSATQLPDPRIEADVGVANTSAHRGICYVVIKDLPLKKYGNSLPLAQIKMEMVKSSGASASQLAVIEDVRFFPEGDLLNVACPFSDLDGTHIWDTGASTWQFPTATQVKRYLLPIGSNDFILMETITGLTPGTQGLYTYPPIGRSDNNTFVHQARDNSSGVDLVYFDLVSPGGNITTLGPVERLPAEGNVFFARQTWYVIHDGVFYVTTFAGSNPFLIYRIEIGTNKIIKLEESNAIVPYNLAVFNDELVVICTDNGDSSRHVYRYNLDTLASIANDTLENYFEVDVSAMYQNITWSPFAAYFRNTTLKVIETLGGSVRDLGGVEPFAASVAGQDLNIFLHGNLIRFWSSHTTGKVYSYSNGAITGDGVSLASIISSECQLADVVGSGDIDVSEISATVDGYILSNNGSIRAALSSLQTAFPFDVIQSGYKIKFVPRGGASVATIDINDLGKNEQWVQTREMDTQLPSKVLIKYLDAGRDYDIAEQYSERLNTDAVNVLTIEIPIVLTADKGKQVIEILLFMYWLERTEFSFVLPPNQRALEASDVITVTLGDITHEVRLTSVNYSKDGSLICTGRPNNASTYISTAKGQGGIDPVTVVGLTGPSIMHLIDVPVIFENIQNESGIMSIMAGVYDAWPGGVISRTNDEGQTWLELQGLPRAATFGLASDFLNVHDGQIFERGDSLTIDMISGTLVSVTEGAMLNGSNIAIYGQAGRWEILRFQTAIDNGDGSFTVSKFIRGDKGTEWATGLHVAADMFVMATDPDNRFMATPTELIGIERVYRGITVGRPVETAIDYTYTYNGENLECLSPVQAAGSRDGSDNLTIVFKRRTRVGGDWRDFADATLSEDSESYEIDIIDTTVSPNIVARTIAVATQTASYSAAEQTTDFGSAQAAVTMKIYQLSAIVGRGRELEATI